MTPAPPTPSEAVEREAIMRQLVAAQHVWETTITPRMIGQLLTFPLTIQQLKVLAILVTDPRGNTAQGLATAIGVSLATMSGILDRLGNQGMLTRTEDPNDHRVRRVVATPQGRETVQRLFTTKPEMDRMPLDRMALDDVRALLQGVQAMVRAMGDDPTPPGTLPDDAPAG
ncbi:DNA-binding transcriptional regulator, MarR family [Sanguibacter gelidistatuariae]|uniref:DNA-binding transcriptional regulator, MarR family n=2 Tax=Sanguibacter gelidistatuariae TaxID=1814289 RepID=A0A1G6GU80_9MICO|nr:DNA-binding transcriptional regulator, MarR family [Sanguibacter gelidistatuariae]